MICIDGEIHSSKNSRRVVHFGNRTALIKSRAALLDEKFMHAQLLEQRGLWDRMTAGFSPPLTVCFYFIRATRRRWDFANLVQGVADAMVKAGYIVDDDVGHFIPRYAGHEVNKERAGVLFWPQNDV